jgi:uncharacterized protein DUF4846
MKTVWLIIIVFTLTQCVYADIESLEYPWLQNQNQSYDQKQSINMRIAPPKDFQRIAVEKGSYAEWLRHLPLKKSGTAVKLFNGKRWKDQTAHHSIIDIDVGKRDLQQCADAIMRLRAEYLYSKTQYNDIGFHFCNGDKIEYKKWRTGYKIGVKKNRSFWVKSSLANKSYDSFRAYMDMIFSYAGTMSMDKDMRKVSGFKDMRIGDVFNYSYHAVMIVDMAENKTTGKKAFLLVQGMMPAMDVHVVRNPKERSLSPWFEVNFNDRFRMHYGFIFGKDNLWRYPEVISREEQSVSE